MNIFSDIFIEAPGDLNLDAFVRILFPLIGIERFEERDSSNYVDGTYFRSIDSPLEVEVCYTDHSGLAAYRFWLSICSEDSTRPAQQAADEFSGILSSHGWRCFIPQGAWYRNGWNGEGRLYEA